MDLRDKQQKIQKDNIQALGIIESYYSLFKKRALVHFAVDPDEVFMATRIEGKTSVFQIELSANF